MNLVYLLPDYPISQTTAVDQTELLTQAAATASKPMPSLIRSTQSYQSTNVSNM
jgi:hypothetical protein